ncbi:MAG: NUDIX hydrolase [Lachnospiraceae bacterium]|nr:NUDIX hydrolase [Lachnospiraceae bacterium]
MKFNGIKKIHEGRFITRYDVSYTTGQGHEKIYEMISRNRDLQTLEDLNNPAVEAVVLVMYDEKHERILLNKEFRLAAGCFVYNFPAGLIDPGESPEQAAERELSEETGLELIRVEDIVGESYSAVGFSNEKNLTVIGTAGGEFRKDNQSEFEEITSAWYTREETAALLKKYPFAGRTQAFCYMFSHS